MRKYFETIVLSDIHLGTAHSKVEQLGNFLRSIDCKRLILNSDIIDGWHLQKSGLAARKTSHTQLVKTIMKMMEHHATEIIYIRGNHDEFIDGLIPLDFGPIRFERDMIYESHGKRYFVTHGDIFDTVTTNMKWLARLGDTGYTALLWLNKIYNNYRARHGRPYYSLSQRIKHRVKSAVSYISPLERELVGLAAAKRCDGIICGHIHQPADTWFDGIHYLNSGDWVESLSALAQDADGDWRVIEYDECECLARAESEEAVGLLNFAS